MWGNPTAGADLDAAFRGMTDVIPGMYSTNAGARPWTATTRLQPDADGISRCDGGGTRLKGSPVSTSAITRTEAGWEASLPRRIVYRTLLGLSTLAAALFGGRLLIAGWFSTLDGGSHRFHDLSWGVLEGAVILVGLVASLWRPARRPIAFQQVGIGLAALLVTMLLIRETDAATFVVMAIIAVAGLLHPSRTLLTRLGPVDAPALLVAALAGAPLVWYALGQAALHRAGPADDPHVAMAHYAGTTAAALAVTGLAFLAASRQPGRRLVVASTAAGLGVLGLGSVLWPDIPSSFGTLGGAAALAGAIAVLAAGLRPGVAETGPHPRQHARAAALVLALGVVGSACGTAAGDAAGSNGPSAETGTDGRATAPTGDVIEVTGVDYAFEDVPETVVTGTSLAFRNASDQEVHEMIVLRVDNDETRSLEELLAMPEAEAEQITQYVGMQVALPGEDGLDPEDPSATAGVTLDAPGRYMLLCFIPEGAEVDAYREAMQSEATGPPPVEGGPPHAAIGMATEITVTDQ